jgi:hypothetical protein
MVERERLLELALKGLAGERAEIDEEITLIKSQLGGDRRVSSGNQVENRMFAAQPRKRRRMSAAARRRISEGMKRRYAAMRAAAKK